MIIPSKARLGIDIGSSYGVSSASTIAEVAASSQTTVNPAAAFMGEVGDRQVVGYYMAEAGACAVTMMMADPATEDAPAASAARLTMTLQPSASAALDTGNGERLAVTCGEGASRLMVDRQHATGKLASR